VAVQERALVAPQDALIAPHPLVAPDGARAAPEESRGEAQAERRGGVPATPGNDDSEPSSLVRLPSALQERIRSELWGEAWARVREAMARAARARAAGREDGLLAPMDESASAEAEGPDAWELARLPSDGRAPRIRASARRGGAAENGGDAERDGSATALDPGDASQGDADAGGAGQGDADGGGVAGAGDGSDPDLFGAPSDDLSGPGSAFELGLVARTRARREGARAPVGEAPPPETDARPELARRQRRESALHRMAVPPAYEAIVREVFAHRPVDGDARP